MALRKLASQFASTTGLRVGISPALQACRESIWRSFATGMRLAAMLLRFRSYVTPLWSNALQGGPPDCHALASSPVDMLKIYWLDSLSEGGMWFSVRLGPGDCSSHVAPCVGMLAAAVSEDRKYASSHEWAKVDGDMATIGISDFAQVLLSW